MNKFYIFLLFTYISHSQPIDNKKNVNFKELPKVVEKKINIDSLLKTDEYIGIEILKHTVKKGERMKNIYIKYKITPGEIYRLNPEAKDSLKVGSTLLIPLEKKVVYREWINPDWEKQNKSKIANKGNYKPPVKIISKSEIPKEEDIKKKINFKDSLNTITKSNTKSKVEILKKESKDIDSTKVKSEIALDDNSKGKGKKSKKKKTKEVIKYGSPDDHDVTLDAKNKEHYVLHEIQEDEALVSIAKKYKVPDYALLEFNKKVDFKKVTAGNLMKIPNIENEDAQNYIYDLISEYRRLNIKYDTEITKRKFKYEYEDTEEVDESKE